MQRKMQRTIAYVVSAAGETSIERRTALAVRMHSECVHSLQAPFFLMTRRFCLVLRISDGVGFFMKELEQAM